MPATNGFDLSQTKPLLVQPWRYTTQPTYSGTTMTSPGTKETLTGVFILLDEAQLTYMREKLTAAQKTTLAAWLWRVSTETPLPAGHLSAAEWNVPMWSGSTRAVFVRIPANVWNNVSTIPPATVRAIFQKLWRD